MNPNRKKKIEAVLNDPASTQNEKRICRDLLNGHPHKNQGRQHGSRYIPKRTTYWRKHQQPDISLKDSATEKKAKQNPYIEILLKKLGFK